MSEGRKQREVGTIAFTAREAAEALVELAVRQQRLTVANEAELACNLSFDGKVVTLAIFEVL